MALPLASPASSTRYTPPDQRSHGQHGPSGPPTSILFVNRVFPPTEGATGAILAELAADLVAAGWRVGVVAGTAPGEPPYRKTETGVHVYRVSGLSFNRTNYARRALACLSLYPMLLNRVLRLDDYDVVVTKTDPPMQLLLGPIIKGRTGQTLIHWAQDLYPEVAETLEVINPEGWFAKSLRRLSTWALRRHDRVIAIGRHMEARIAARGVDRDRIDVMPNWPLDPITSVPHEDNAFRHEQGLEGKFVVMYSGNMGLAHCFEPVVDAAAKLQHEPDIVFLFVGNGTRRAEIKAQVERRRLSNVRFLPFQPLDRLAESLSAGDLHLVTMQNGTEGLVVPSKVYGALAAGRPQLLIGSGKSEAARIVREHDCGTVLPEATGAGVAAAIREWKRDPMRRQAAGRRARLATANARGHAVAAFKSVVQQARGVQPVEYAL